MRKNVSSIIAVLIVATFFTGYSVIIQSYLDESGLLSGSSIFDGNGREISILVPAIDNNNRGIITLMNVKAIEGSGNILVGINDILFWVDTQASIRTSEKLAENITGKTISNTDIIYTLETPGGLIEGESAGAAITAATVALLEDKNINNSVMITGTIKSDGSIGKIGGIVEKARAAKSVGARLFIVPAGQGSETVTEPVRSCDMIGDSVYCRTDYISMSLSEALDIEVIEVSNIQEALKYLVV